MPPSSPARPAVIVPDFVAFSKVGVPSAPKKILPAIADLDELHAPKGY